MSFAFRVQGARATRGPAALSVALSVTATTRGIEIGPLNPMAAHTIDTDGGDFDSTATASGGDNSSYAYAWTVTETADDFDYVAVLVAGTQNIARYNTLTLRVSQPAILDGGGNPTGANPFFQSIYTLRCTVTDGAGDDAYAEYVVTLEGQ